jgi:rubrerythrin
MTRIDKTLAIIKQAIEIEQFGYDFYNNMRSFVRNRVGQKVISHLANLEVDHIKWLEEEYDRQLDSLDEFDENTTIDVSLEGKSEIFIVDKLTEVFESTDHEEALEFAIEVEHKSMQFYKHNMDISEDDRISELFGKLADFEREHITLLQENLASIKSGGPWVFKSSL